MIDIDKETTRLLPKIIKIAKQEYKKNVVLGLYEDDYISAATDGLMYGLRTYDEKRGVSISLEKYCWYAVKSRVVALRSKGSAKKNSLMRDAHSLDGVIDVDNKQEPIHLSDTVGVCDPAYDDIEMILLVFTYAKDEIDVQILNGMLFGMTMEQIGNNIGMTKQAVHVRYHQIRNKARAGLKW